MQSKHNQPCGLGDIAVSELVLQLDAAAAVDRTKWTDESLAVLDSAVATANALTSDGQSGRADGRP